MATSTLEVERWIERADRLRRAIDGALTQYAASEGLAADFNERFFPNSAGPRKAKKARAAESSTATRATSA